MIVADAAAFVQARALLRPDIVAPALPSAVFLVRPDGFGIERESATDNEYMARSGDVDVERACRQHDALVREIQRAGVPVFVLPGVEGQKDGVFPNNVFATAPGRFVVGSMRHPARRREAERADVRALFEGAMRRTTIDLSARDCVAELTGPLIVDRGRGIGFCGMTPRVDDAGCAAMHDAFALRLTYRFPLAPSEYHTNVVLSVLAGRAAVLHPGSFADPKTPGAIERVYPGATIVLSVEEKAAFAGNCIALTDRDVFLSATADRALRPATRSRFEALGFVLHAVQVDEIEKAGGSVRCMIAEVY